MTISDAIDRSSHGTSLTKRQVRTQSGVNLFSGNPAVLHLVRIDETFQQNKSIDN